MTIEQQNDFHDFVKEIPLLLSDLQHLLKESKNYKDVVVNFKDDGMLAIGSFYVDVWNGNEKTNAPQEKLDRIFMAYYGEAIVHHFGGEWELNDIKKDTSFKWPVIVGWGKNKDDNVRISPMEARENMKKEMRKDGIVFRVTHIKEMSEKINNLFRK